MYRSVRAGVTALAFLGLVAQPLVANAGWCWPCPPPPCEIAKPAGTAGPLPMLFVVGYFLCAGMAIGKVDEDARRAHKPVAKGAHAKALLACLIPIPRKGVTS